MKEKKGVFYFKTRDSAIDWATKNGWPTKFIREFISGFAVQACDSGRYAGSGQMTHPGNDWNNPSSESI